MDKNRQELLPVVNENDELIDIRPRKEIHRQALRHRAAQVLVFNSQGELLIQRRARGKDRYPGYLDVSVGGHVAPNETYDHAAKRELKEELGIQARLSYLTKIKASRQTGWEHIKLYQCVYDGEIKPNPREVSDCCFLKVSALQQRIKQGLIKVTPSLKVSLDHYLSIHRKAEIE